MRAECILLRNLGVVSSTTFGFSTAPLPFPARAVFYNAQADDAQRRTLLTSSAGLENAKKLVTAYKTGKMPEMTPELWDAKKIIDSTLHPGTLVGQSHNGGVTLTEFKTRDNQSSCPFACHPSF